MLLSVAAFAQYPGGINKQRLGFQTTADGLVWRGAIGDTATIDPVGLLQAWALVDTASGVLYQYRGKAWRPVLAYAIQPFDSVVFNDNQEDADSAELKYNADIGSLVYGVNDGAQIPVLPGHWYVRNDTSVTLTKGTLVRAVGTIGASGRIKVRHMIGDNSISAEYVMGIVVKDIPAGEDGYIMFYGKIRKLNTDVWNEGDLLYPDDFTPGALTNAPVYFKTPIAFVVHKSINQGVIAVRIQTENYLSRLHDVTLPGLAAQNILRYSGQYWIPGRDTSVYDFDARLKGNRTVLMNNFDVKFRNQYSENNYVQIRPTFVMVSDSTTGEQVALNKYGIAGPVTGGYLSEVRLANGVYLNGSNSRFVEGLDTGDGYDVTIDTVGRVRFRVSATGTADSLYGKTSSGLLTAIKPNYLAYTDTASMLSTYLRPSEILAGTGITLLKDSTVTISAPTTLSSATENKGIAEVVVDGLSTLRLPWDGTAVVGILTDYLYFFVNVNGQSSQHPLIPDGDKGDITTTKGGAVMTIDTGVVSLAKLSSGVRDTLVGKLNIADTLSMLSTYINREDTAAMLSAYIKDSIGTVTSTNLLTGAVTGAKLGAITSAELGAALTDETGTGAAVFGTNPTISGATITTGSINNTPIGASTANTGAFTTLTASSTLTVTGAGSIEGLTVGRGNNAFVTNTALGASTLTATQTGGVSGGGQNNTAVGYRAMRFATSSQLNTAVGANALRNLTNAIGLNTAVGYNALLNTNASSNTAMGYRVMETNTSGEENAAFGYEALFDNTSGENNSAFGFRALDNNTTGSNNTALGYQTLTNNTTGSNNIGIGRFAGQSSTTGNTIGNHNIYIGVNAVGSANNNWNEIVIGSGAVGNGRNSVTLGNDTIATTLLRGRVGIRQTSPLQALHVRGKVRVDTLNSTPLFIAGIGTDSTLIRLSTDSLPSIAELRHVKGVTSAIQTQLNTKLNATDTASLSNRINLKLNATDTASLSNRINAFPVTYEYTTVITDSLVTIPSGCKTIEIVCIGGGGGGGSGRRGVASGQTVATGGTGGSGAAYSFISLDASAITAQLKITVGAGGTGGAVRTTNDTNGANGTNGKASSVYTGATGSPANALLIYAGGGGAGEGGQSPGLGLDSLGERHYGDFSGKTGGYGDGQNADVFTGIAVVTKASGGGGGGGRITAGTTENNGGNGGAAGYAKITSTNRGTTATPNATAGYTPVAGQSFGGGGGGGGASKASGGGGNGGAGVRGGGGGGGGASINGVNSGAGGNGGTGYVRITFY